VGVVTHYFSERSVAVIHLESGMLRVGDTIHIKGHTTDFTQRIESLQVEHETVNEVGPQDNFGVKVVAHAREHDIVYKVS
jgi:translation elongation factor EF-1alpha